MALATALAATLALPSVASAAKDRTAPTVPARFAAAAASTSSVKVAWSASRDASGISAYLVFRNGARTPTATLTNKARSWTDTGRAANTTYTYVIRVRDRAGNLSRTSKIVRARTPKANPATGPGTRTPATVAPIDRVAPTAPRTLTAVALSDRSVSVTWAAATDDVGVASYVVYRDEAIVATVPGATLTFVSDGLRPLTPYSFHVRAVDAAKNTSASSPIAQVTTLATLPVTIPGRGGDGGDDGAGDDDGAVEDPAAALTLAVGLGDSFSSGMGSETTPIAPSAFWVPADRQIDQSVYETVPGGGRHPCQRTLNNAARRIASAKGFTLRDASCAGAVTADILGGGPQPLAPQIDSVTADAALVTLTIGGNDTQLLGLLGCVAAGECTASSPEAIYTHAQNDLLQARITNVLDAIKARAPYAQIRIAGYPYLVPVPGSPVGLCGSVLSDAERVLMKTEHDRTTAAAKAAADAAGPRVRFVDANQPGSPFNALDAGAARDGCATNVNRWLNGAADAVDGVGGWHPNSRGYAFYAQLYLATL